MLLLLYVCNCNKSQIVSVTRIIYLQTEHFNIEFSNWLMFGSCSWKYWTVRFPYRWQSPITTMAFCSPIHITCPLHLCGRTIFPLTHIFGYFIVYVGDNRVRRKIDFQFLIKISIILKKQSALHNSIFFGISSQFGLCREQQQLFITILYTWFRQTIWSINWVALPNMSVGLKIGRISEISCVDKTLSERR